MAISPNYCLDKPLHTEELLSTEKEVIHTIQGIPIVVYITMPETEISVIPNVENFMKEKLTELLAEEILKSELCEFTKQNNLENFTVTYRARAFLTPKDEIKLLREKSIIK